MFKKDNDELAGILENEFRWAKPDTDLLKECRSVEFEYATMSDKMILRFNHDDYMIYRNKMNEVPSNGLFWSVWDDFYNQTLTITKEV